MIWFVLAAWTTYDTGRDETAVMVLKVNEAVEAARRLEFKPDEFKV